MADGYDQARKELRDYFLSAIGVAAQRYDSVGGGSDTDPSGRLFERMDRARAEVRQYERVREVLEACEHGVRAILRAAFEPGRLDPLVRVARLYGPDTSEGQARSALDAAVGIYDQERQRLAGFRRAVQREMRAAATARALATVRVRDEVRRLFSDEDAEALRAMAAEIGTGDE
jgi:hypothetical protein